MAYSKTLNLDKALKKLPECSGFLVAYSGGSDSTALLHLFSSLENIKAIHINHGINKDAELWQTHCIETCKNLNIPLIVEKFDLPDSSENTCRKARYSAFKKHLKPNEILLTAHHAGDQAETILLKLLRGTGLNGISGMDEISTFHQGYLARLLLKNSADELKQYLIKNNINWIEDDSNQNNDYRRNYIRNEIIPSFEKHWSNAIDTISRTGENIRNSALLLDHYTSFMTKQLSIEQLIELPKKLQSTLFYHWLSSKNLPVLDKAIIDEICRSFIDSGTDKNPYYHNKHYQLIRWKNAIYCLQNFEKIKPVLSFKWNTKTKFRLPNKCGQLVYHGNDELDLVIKFNQTGEKIKPIYRNHTRTVKNLFQENQVPTWDKYNTPYIYLNGELISLGTKWSAIDAIGLEIEVTFQDLLV